MSQKSYVLSLKPELMFWSLQHPLSREYISPITGLGFQEHVLIFTDADRGPKEVNLNNYPEWAQDMIMSGINTGVLRVHSSSAIESEVAVEAPARPISEKKDIMGKGKNKKNS